MSDISEMVKRLIDAGTPADIAAEVVVSVFAAGARTKKAPKEQVDYTPEFLKFWKAYPVTQGMSKKTAMVEWNKLSEANRELAVKALPDFRAWVTKTIEKHPDHVTLHACRYLSQRRFESFTPTVSTDTGVFVHREDPRWPMLSRLYQLEKHIEPPTDRHGGWRFPNNWLNGNH